jgi:2-C-methyl-D-erythritol 2,4-cyclodiphosphate synthase
MNGYTIAWIDATIIAERPKISSFIEEMKSALSGAGIHTGMINIKAKTNEGMGFIGRGEGIAAQAICLLSRI